MFENDYTINGKHATYLKFLAVKNARDDDGSDGTNRARLFERYIDVYMNAAIWGLLYQRTAPRDNTSNDRARIYADAFSNEHDNCVFLYRLVMLLDKTTDLSQDERIDRAFKYDTLDDKKEEFAKCMELFNSYVRGGIEQMYETYTDGCTTRDDYLDKTYEVLSDFKKEVDGYSYEEELKKLMK